MLRRPPDLLITTPESLYLMLTSNAADTLVNVETVIVDEIHALAATKRGAHLAVSLERLEEITAQAAPAHRPVGDPASARRGRPLPRRLVGAGHASRRRHRRRRDLQAAGDRRRHPRRGHVRSRRSGRRRRTPASTAARRSSRRCRGARASGRRSTRASSSRSSPTARRSCSATPGARPSASPPSSTSCTDEQNDRRSTPDDWRVARRPGQGAPRVARPRAADHRRGRAQARRPPGHRRHEQPRAGHRHGRRRPRRAGRVAGRRVPRPAAHRPGRPPGRRAEPGDDLSEASWRPARGGGRGPADDRRGDRAHPLPAQPARRARPADRRPRRRPRRGRRRRRGGDGAGVGDVRRAVRRAAAQHPGDARRGATRPRSSPSCGRGSCGTGPTTRCAPATARSASP